MHGAAKLDFGQFGPATAPTLDHHARANVRAAKRQSRRAAGRDHPGSESMRSNISPRRTRGAQSGLVSLDGTCI